MPYRFVHTADLHLDSPLKSLAMRDTALAEVIGNASRAVFTRIIDLCIEEAVNALLIAGDLYDGAQTSMKTARFLTQELRRLDQAGIETFIIRGNHDAESRITAQLVLPPSVKLFGAQADVARRVTGKGLEIAIHGISFARPHAPESLLGRFKAPVPGAVNIGMMHTSLDGAAGHDPYAPCRLTDLQDSGFDYWALGHIHARAHHAGRCHVVMPGIPQGRDIGETGAKSVTLVHVADDGAVSVAERPVAVARFARLEVPLDLAEDWPGVVSTLSAALRAARREHAEDHLVLRPVLSGRTPLLWRLRRDLGLLTAEARLTAEGIGTLWIDKLELTCTDAASPDTAGPLAELARQIAQMTTPPAVILTEADAVMEALAKSLPRDVRGMLGDDPAARAAVRDALLQEGAAEVLAHLHGLEGDG
ncbi:MAG: DNA repair exonuclease [Rhodobacterales bacterium]|nr:DNA repair exonuclease [Rhodobacterales bacterium]